MNQIPTRTPVKTRIKPAATRANATPYARDLDYIGEELDWIEARARRVAFDRLLAEAQEPDVERSYRRDQPPPRAQLVRDRAGALRREKSVRARIERRLAVHRGADSFELALDMLCRVHGLDDFERTTLLLGAAPCFSGRFDELYERMASGGCRSDLSVEMIYAFSELSFADRIHRRRTFAADSPLARNDLVNIEIGGRYTEPKDLLTADVALTTRTFAALLGDDRLPHEFAEFSSLEQPLATLDQVVLDPADKRRILSVVDRHDEWLQCRREWGFDARIAYGRGALMLFFGAPGTGKTMTAHGVAAHLGKRVFNVDIPAFVQAHDADRFLPSLFREARLQNAVLFFDECETLFASRRKGNALMTLLLTEIERFEGVAILATNQPAALDEALDRRLLVKVRFPEPDRTARRAIWVNHLPEQAPLAADIDLDALADRYELTGGFIKNAVLMAVAAAIHDCDDPATAQIAMAHLETAARDQLIRPRDDDTELVYPQVRADQVVLGAALVEQVQEVIGAARNRRSVLHRWGVGGHLSRGKGVVALLSGPPGTGKTLTAEAIASELGRPLLPVGSSTVLSKWVGDTERRIERIFEQARDHHAVLFIDECDSLLGSRDAERNGDHSVSRVNTLLRLVERHEGVVLLASNRPDSLDAALIRRLSHHLRFQLPDAAARERIWAGLLPETVPTDGRLDLGVLARHFPLSGASICNAAMRACFRAATAQRGVRQRDLQEAAAQEVPADMGPEATAMLVGGIEA